jgi:hypothetical protein
MNNFYHKIAVASVGIALGFTLGTYKEAKAATITLTETSKYHLTETDQDGLPDSVNTNESLAVGIREPWNTTEEYRSFYEFNITDLFLGSNTIIDSAILKVSINYIRWYRPHSRLEAYGYTENEKVDALGVYNAGRYLDQGLLKLSPFSDRIKGTVTFNVLSFINQRIESNNSFAGFGIRFLNKEGAVYLDSRRAQLIVTTDKPEPITDFGLPPEPITDFGLTPEPIPEPTTIFGSAIGLCLGGWLKRRKSALQKKTTS